MANITIDAGDVHVIRLDEGITQPTGEAVGKGEYVRLNGTTGRLEYGNATTAGELGNLAGLTISTPPYLGAPVTAMRKGLLNVGDALDALDFGAPVYVSDTDGTLADAADGTVDLIVGYVYPIPNTYNGGTPDKCLYVDLT